MSENTIINKDIQNIVLGKFTKKEIEVLDYIASGHSNSDIARILVLSKSTVNTHLHHIFQKLNIEDPSKSTLRVKVALFWLKHRTDIVKN